LAGTIPGLKVTDIGSVQRQVASSLSAVGLRGLTILELSFAVVFVVGATGLALFLSLSERRHSFAVLSALGAKRRHLAAFMWSEAVTILSGGGLVGMCLGWLVAFALVKVLAGVFDPPPETLTVPWIYLLLLCICAGRRRGNSLSAKEYHNEIRDFARNPRLRRRIISSTHSSESPG
jgi:putative ABC transport system permease protein